MQVSSFGGGISLLLQFDSQRTRQESGSGRHFLCFALMQEKILLRLLDEILQRGQSHSNDAAKMKNEKTNKQTNKQTNKAVAVRRYAIAIDLTLFFFDVVLCCCPDPSSEEASGHQLALSCLSRDLLLRRLQTHQSEASWRQRRAGRRTATHARIQSRSGRHRSDLRQRIGRGWSLLCRSCRASRH